MSDPVSKTTDRKVLWHVSKWTEEIERQMLAEGMSDAAQVRHWHMLAFVAERTVEELNHVG